MENRGKLQNAENAPENARRAVVEAQKSARVCLCGQLIKRTTVAAAVVTATRYELWKAIWSGLNDRNLFELAHAPEHHNSYLDTFVPLTFVGNYNVMRIASPLNDKRHLPHALAIVFNCGGTPSIYKGD